MSYVLGKCVNSSFSASKSVDIFLLKHPNGKKRLEYFNRLLKERADQRFEGLKMIPVLVFMTYT